MDTLAPDVAPDQPETEFTEILDRIRQADADGDASAGVAAKLAEIARSDRDDEGAHVAD